jgi:hypothetical protein
MSKTIIQSENGNKLDVSALGEAKANVSSTVGLKPGDLNLDADKDLQVDIKSIDKINGISSETISADNAAATITLTAPLAGQAHYIYGIQAGFSGAATKLATIKDGLTVVENIVVVNSHNENRVKPLKITDATACEISLAASGGLGVVGYLTVRYETR